MKEMADRAERAGSLEELLGLEGNGARLYFGDFAGMIKPDEGREALDLSFDFEGRNRRPPRDPVNALLSLGYSLLAKDLTVACYAVGFDPYIGFYHQPRFGRPALALDLMEPFRPLIVDSAVLTAINTGMVTPRDFVRVGGSVALTASGRKAFFRAYELRMDTLVTHPLFDYRVSYRRMLEIQSRLLARVLGGRNWRVSGIHDAVTTMRAVGRRQDGEGRSHLVKTCVLCGLRSDAAARAGHRWHRRSERSRGVVQVFENRIG